MATVTKTERQALRESLLERLQPGDIVYTIVTHVASSGMSRKIRVFVIRGNQPIELSRQVAELLGLTFTVKGVRISGVGMDMGFELIYQLSSALWPDGYECSGRDCNSNDHVNGDRIYKPHQHKDGGYALRQEWL